MYSVSSKIILKLMGKQGCHCNETNDRNCKRKGKGNHKEDDEGAMKLMEVSI